MLDTLECGIQLVGSEVKSLRIGGLSLDEAYGRIEKDEVWLINCEHRRVHVLARASTTSPSAAASFSCIAAR